MTKKRDYIPARIRRSKLHRIKQYCTDLFENDESDKPNYMKEVHELLYHDEEGITLSWVDGRRVFRRIKVSDVPINALLSIINKSTPNCVDPRDEEYDEFDKYTRIFYLHGNHSL